MIRWMMSLMLCGVIAIAVARRADAQYDDRPSASDRGSVASKSGSFERAVDLTRFRKGNYEWDTQEYLKSGFTALHEDHAQVLRELTAIRAELERLSAEVRRLSAERSR